MLEMQNLVPNRHVGLKFAFQCWNSNIVKSIKQYAGTCDDLFFVVDPYSHLSPKGWAYYDQTLDAFYHNKLAQP